MRNKRPLATLLATVLMVVGFLFGISSPAMASSGTIYTPGGHGRGTWNVNTTNETLTLSATAYSNLPAGRCVTMYVDIARASGVPAGSNSHYDARAARTCTPGKTMSVGIQYEGSTYGINITGINKLGVCESQPTQLGTCFEPVGSLSSVNPNPGNPCTRFWVWKSTSPGYNYYWAGNVFSCQN